MAIRFGFRQFLLLVLLAVFGSLPATAATLIHLTLDEMTDQSSAVLLGQCVEVRSEWNADHTQIVTRNVFEVREYYKGNLGKRVTITELGGQVGEWVSEFSGMPRFQVGEESALFVWTDPHGEHQVIGLTQGKFGVRRNSQSGSVELWQAQSVHPPLEPPSHRHTEAAGPLAMPLTVLRDRVQLLLKKPAGGARQ